jgi:hypothetical protein
MIECLYLVKSFQPSLISLNERNPFIHGRLLSMRSERERLPETNAVAYFASPSVNKKKSFITLTPGHSIIKEFMAGIYECS